MSCTMATDTQEYEVFRSNFDRLVTAVAPAIGEVSRKAFEKNLITQENVSSAMNMAIPEESRSTTLLNIILTKVREKNTHFDTFLSILLSIPTLVDLAHDLSKERIKTINSGSFEDSEAEATTNLKAGDHAIACVSPPLSFCCRCGNNCSLDTYVSGKCCRQLEETFPYLNIKYLSERDKEKLLRKLTRDANKMAQKFQELTYTSFKSLKKRNVPVDEVRDIALNYRGHKQYQEGHCQKLGTATTIIEINSFLVDHKYISFFNYRILEKIIKELGTAEDNANLEKYLQEFGTFCKRSVFEVPAWVFTNTDHAPEETLAVKVNENLWFGCSGKSAEMNEFTVNDVYAVVDAIAEAMEVESALLVLRDVKKGCVELSLEIVSTEDVPTLNSLQLEKLEQSGIKVLQSTTTFKDNERKDRKEAQAKWETKETEYKTHVQTLAKQIDEMRGSLRNAESSLQAQAHQIDGANKEITELKDEIQSRTQQVKLYKKQVDSYRDEVQADKELIKLSVAIEDSLKKENDALRHQVTNLQAKTEDVERKCHNLEKMYQDVLAKNEDLQMKCVMATSELEALKKQQGAPPTSTPSPSTSSGYNPNVQRGGLTTSKGQERYGHNVHWDNEDSYRSE